MVNLPAVIRRIFAPPSQASLNFEVPNLSPWIHQLNPQRATTPLDKDVTTEVAVVGAGIAGVTTAYFILKNTPHSVVLIEGSKVAHGATGHNAGQMVSYFERQLCDLTKEFGLELTAQAQRAVNTAWDLFENLYQDAHLTTPYALFTGFAGCQDLEEVLVHLENIVVAQKAQLPIEPLMVSETAPFLSQIPPQYQSLYTIVPHQKVIDVLETKDQRYMAALSARKGCMNSALFCQDLVQHLLQAYPDRFQLFEDSPMSSVELSPTNAVLKIDQFRVTAQKVVLCTNGFERFTIKNRAGQDINTKFHHLVNGVIGYMAGYLEPQTKTPIAISYLPDKSQTGNRKFDDNPYFYLTRRDFELGDKGKYNLVCVGGPQSLMDDATHYKKEHPYPEEAQAVIDEFLHSTYAYAPEGQIKYHYTWHGLMGYTPNGVRCIGPEPLNPVLLYNLGCNGVGILPSIYGGKKISQFLNQEPLEKSIFDPQVSLPQPH